MLSLPNSISQKKNLLPKHSILSLSQVEIYLAQTQTAFFSFIGNSQHDWEFCWEKRFAQTLYSINKIMSL
jgi:hypothetical protein